MADLEMIRARLEKKITTSGHTFREVSLKIGRKDSYIQQYIKYGFPKRLSEIDRKKICQYLGMEEKELIDDELIKSGAADFPALKMQNIKQNVEDFVLIDIYEPQNFKNLEDGIIGRMAVNYKAFYGWFNGNPYNIRMIRYNSDSMEPMVASGSLVMYDSSQVAYNGDGIYIISYDNQITLKRIQKTSSEGYILKTENPRYQDIRCEPDEIEILGRAINCMHTRPL